MDYETKQIENFPLEKTWSPWATTWIALGIIAAGSLFLQLLVGAAYVGIFMVKNGLSSYYDVQVQKYIQDLFSSSEIISSSILISDAASISLLLWVVHRKAPGMGGAYFGFQRFEWKPFVFWQIVMVAIYYITSKIAESSGVSEPEFMKFMKDIMSNQSVLDSVFIFIALVVAAPFFEEMMFRGFIFRGLVNSKIRLAGAIVLPALAWSLIHLQYEAIWVFIIFLMGLVFGAARYQTGSIITVISMHALNNLMSFVDVIHN